MPRAREIFGMLGLAFVACFFIRKHHEDDQDQQYWKAYQEAKRNGDPTIVPPAPRPGFFGKDPDPDEINADPWQSWLWDPRDRYSIPGVNGMRAQAELDYMLNLNKEGRC